MDIKQLNEQLKELVEAQEDLDNITKISNNALINDNHDIPNKQALAYRARRNNGKHYNYNRVVNDLLQWVKDNKADLAEEIENLIKELKDKHSYISKSKSNSIIIFDTI